MKMKYITSLVFTLSIVGSGYLAACEYPHPNEEKQQNTQAEEK